MKGPSGIAAGISEGSALVTVPQGVGEEGHKTPGKHIGAEDEAQPMPGEAIAATKTNTNARIASFFFMGASGGGRGNTTREFFRPLSENNDSPKKIRCQKPRERAESAPI